MKTEYPKAFEKYYAKYHSRLTTGESGLNGQLCGLLKDFAFHAWSAAAKRVTARIGAINKWSDHNWQHEDVDGLKDYTKSLYKDE